MFDEPDVVYRAGELAGFIEDAQSRHGIGKPIAVGFSKGANIAAAMLLLHPVNTGGAVLIRAMTPLYRPTVTAELKGIPVLMLTGAMDPIVSEGNAANLAATLSRHGAALRHEILPSGHALTRLDMTLAREFLEKLR